MNRPFTSPIPGRTPHRDHLGLEEQGQKGLSLGDGDEQAEETSGWRQKCPGQLLSGRHGALPRTPICQLLGKTERPQLQEEHPRQRQDSVRRVGCAEGGSISAQQGGWFFLLLLFLTPGCFPMVFGETVMGGGMREGGRNTDVRETD